MRSTAYATTLVFLMLGTPAFAGLDRVSDGDGVADSIDNCSETANDAQDDTDSDDCGNSCDADYDQSGVVSLADFGLFSAAFGGGDELFCHVQPIPGCVVGLDDFGFFAAAFSWSPGPSGTTSGTTECPL